MVTVNKHSSSQMPVCQQAHHTSASVQSRVHFYTVFELYEKLAGGGRTSRQSEPDQNCDVNHMHIVYS